MWPFGTTKSSSQINASPRPGFQPTVELLEGRVVPVNFVGTHPLVGDLAATTAFAEDGSSFLTQFSFTGSIPVGEGFNGVGFDRTSLPVLENPVPRAGGTSITRGFAIHGGQFGDGTELVQEPTSGAFSRLVAESRFIRPTIAITGTASEEELTVQFTGTQFDTRTGELLSAPIPTQTFQLQAVDDVDLTVGLGSEDASEFLGRGVIETATPPATQVRTILTQPNQPVIFAVELSTEESQSVGFRFGVDDLNRPDGWSITSQSRFLSPVPVGFSIAPFELAETTGIRTGNGVIPGVPRRVVVTFTPSEDAAPGSQAEVTIPVRLDLGQGNRILDAVKLVVVLEGENQPPDAVDDDFELDVNFQQFGQPLPFNAGEGNGVLANDNDPEDDSVSIVDPNSLRRTQLGAGATLQADGSFIYDVTQLNFADLQISERNGGTLQDTFTYEITDDQGRTDQATVTLTLNVAGVPEPPSNNDDNSDSPVPEGNSGEPPLGPIVPDEVFGAGPGQDFDQTLQNQQQVLQDALQGLNRIGGELEDLLEGPLFFDNNGKPLVLPPEERTDENPTQGELPPGGGGLQFFFDSDRRREISLSFLFFFPTSPSPDTSLFGDADRRVSNDIDDLEPPDLRADSELLADINPDIRFDFSRVAPTESVSVSEPRKDEAEDLVGGELWNGLENFTPAPILPVPQSGSSSDGVVPNIQLDKDDAGSGAGVVAEIEEEDEEENERTVNQPTKSPEDSLADDVFERLQDLNSVGDDNLPDEEQSLFDELFERLQDLNDVGENNLPEVQNPGRNGSSDLTGIGSDSQSAVPDNNSEPSQSAGNESSSTPSRKEQAGDGAGLTGEIADAGQEEEIGDGPSRKGQAGDGAESLADVPASGSGNN